ncbi:MAG: 6,7-dimethyl-8-ribityllumazine synthase [Chitinophagaceae bacterium]
MATNSSSFLQGTGLPSVKEARVAIFSTEWNMVIVDQLLEGCERILVQHGVTQILKIKVPGAFELPFSCKRFWELHAEDDMKPDVMICLGAVVRGETPHFEYVCRAVTDGILSLNLLLPVPTIFGILTVDDEKQARSRVGGSKGHKGEEAALTAIKMYLLNQQFSSRV